MMSAAPIAAAIKVQSEVPAEFVPQPQEQSPVQMHLAEEDYCVMTQPIQQLMLQQPQQQSHQLQQQSLQHMRQLQQGLQQQQQPQGLQEASSAIDKTKYKTRLCRNYTNGQECPYGDRCVFAHGEHEKKREGVMPNGVVDLSTQPATIVPQTVVIRRQQPAVLKQVPQVVNRSPLSMSMHVETSSNPSYAYMNDAASNPVYFSPQQNSFEQSCGYESHSFASESAETSGMQTPQQALLPQSLTCTPCRSPQPAGAQSPSSVCLEPAHPRSCDDRSLCPSPSTTTRSAHYRYEPYGTGVVQRVECSMSSSCSSNAISDCDSPSDSPRQEPIAFQI